MQKVPPIREARRLKIIAVIGARPNFVKIAPLAWEAAKHSDVEFKLVHTGQHYDDQLSTVFFRELKIPTPEFRLEVGSGSHAVQTAEVMKRFEPLLISECPNLVLVVGDVNSTLACAITSVKAGIPVAHVEAGLRSFDENMPEEINRILTDRISRWLFVTEPSGVDNLRREGIPPARIHLVGNVMIDTLEACRERFNQSEVIERLNLIRGQYGVVTLHRPSNVDQLETLSGLLSSLASISEKLPLVFPAHPRTASKLKELGALSQVAPQIRVIEPLGYFDFLCLEASAKLLLTDSGGVQEEATALGIPCLTLRLNTERPVTISQGTNQLVGTDPIAIKNAAASILDGRFSKSKRPDLWDGHASKRIFDVLLQEANQ